jgi:hypothetical protein
MNQSRNYDSGAAAQLDAVAAALAPSVHAVLDREPSEGVRNALHAAASRRVYHHARMITYVWRSAVSVAAAAVLAVGAWSIQNHRSNQRLQLLDHLLVLAAAPDVAPVEQDVATESLAERLLLLQGFDVDVTAPEAVESPAPPATDAQWRNRRVLLTRICG